MSNSPGAVVNKRTVFWWLPAQGVQLITSALRSICQRLVDGWDVEEVLLKYDAKLARAVAVQLWGGQGRSAFLTPLFEYLSRRMQILA